MVQVTKIGKVEFEKLGGRTSTQKEVTKELEKLGVDEGIVIEIANYPLKGSPTTFVYAYAKDSGKKFSCRNLKERGWAVLRTE